MNSLNLPKRSTGIHFTAPSYIFQTNAETSSPDLSFVKRAEIGIEWSWDKNDMKMSSPHFPDELLNWPVLIPFEPWD
jgi:hypothetical protein